MVEQINLPEDPGPAVGGHLLDDLDCVLHLGVDVDTGLDTGVGPLTQNLACQPVQLLEGVGGQGGGAGCLLLLSASGFRLFLAS